MKVLVCGGRDFNDYHEVNRALSDIHEQDHITEIIHGGASGADTLAGRWAKAHGIPVSVFPADWATFGKRAGPLRNQRMLEDREPELVVAFPGGAGTEDMVRRAEAAHVRVERPKMTRRFSDG